MSRASPVPRAHADATRRASFVPEDRDGTVQNLGSVFESTSEEEDAADGDRDAARASFANTVSNSEPDSDPIERPNGSDETIRPTVPPNTPETSASISKQPSVISQTERLREDATSPHARLKNHSRIGKSRSSSYSVLGSREPTFRLSDFQVLGRSTHSSSPPSGYRREMSPQYTYRQHNLSSNDYDLVDAWRIHVDTFFLSPVSSPDILSVFGSIGSTSPNPGDALAYEPYADASFESTSTRGQIVGQATAVISASSLHARLRSLPEQAEDEPNFRGVHHAHNSQWEDGRSQRDPRGRGNSRGGVRGRGGSQPRDASSKRQGGRTQEQNTLLLHLEPVSNGQERSHSATSEKRAQPNQHHKLALPGDFPPNQTVHNSDTRSISNPEVQSAGDSLGTGSLPPREQTANRTPDTHEPRFVRGSHQPNNHPPRDTRPGRARGASGNSPARGGSNTFGRQNNSTLPRHQGTRNEDRNNRRHSVPADSGGKRHHPTAPETNTTIMTQSSASAAQYHGPGVPLNPPDSGPGVSARKEVARDSTLERLATGAQDMDHWLKKSLESRSQDEKRGVEWMEAIRKSHEGAAYVPSDQTADKPKARVLVPWIDASVPTPAISPMPQAASSSRDVTFAQGGFRRPKPGIGYKGPSETRVDSGADLDVVLPSSIPRAEGGGMFGSKPKGNVPAPKFLGMFQPQA